MLFSKLTDIAEIRFCSVSPSRMKTQEERTLWLSCSNFASNNVITGEPSELNLATDENLAIHNNDIVIKRIAPSYVNYISNMKCDLFAGNNLIIITAHECVNAKYLAMHLNELVSSISESSSSGAVMRSLNRSDFEKIEIPIVKYDIQEKIGESWFLNIELKKLKNKLIELEYTKRICELNKYIATTGEKNDD